MRRCIVKCTWFLFLATLAPRAGFSGETLELALIIGNNVHTSDASKNLRYADDDAIRAAEEFRMLHPGGQVWLLVEPDEETLERLGTRSVEVLATPSPTSEPWVLESVDAEYRDSRTEGAANDIWERSRPPTRAG